MTLTVRDARSDDAAAIAAMNNRMAEETEHRTLECDVLLAGVRAVLGDARRGRYWVAELNGAVVGQTLITPEWSDWRNGWIWWLSSVYVEKSARRQGVFRALYQHVHEAARAAGVVALRLYVERDNRVAQETYRRLGMDATGYLVLERCPL